MNVAVLICTHGEGEWERKGVETLDRHPVSAFHGQHFIDVSAHHHDGWTLAQIRNSAATTMFAKQASWLCFVDAGDELCSGYFDHMERALRAHIESEPQVPSEASRHVPPILAPALSFDRGKTHAIPNKGRWPLLNECCIGTLVSRQTFERVGGFHEWPSLEDYDLWLRCVSDGARIVHVPEAVYCAEPSPTGRNADQSCVVAIRRANARVFDGRH